MLFMRRRACRRALNKWWWWWWRPWEQFMFYVNLYRLTATSSLRTLAATHFLIGKVPNKYKCKLPWIEYQLIYINIWWWWLINKFTLHIPMYSYIADFYVQCIFKYICMCHKNDKVLFVCSSKILFCHK